MLNLTLQIEKLNNSQYSYEVLEQDPTISLLKELKKSHLIYRSFDQRTVFFIWMCDCEQCPQLRVAYKQGKNKDQTYITFYINSLLNTKKQILELDDGWFNKKEYILFREELKKEGINFKIKTNLFFKNMDNMF